jgi:uncharacterized protein YigE (DUF2233 family)
MLMGMPRPAPKCLFFLLLTTLATRAGALASETIRAGGMTYTVATVVPGRDRVTLHWLNPTTHRPYRTFTELRERLRKEGRPLLFVTNSGIYAPGLRPLGLHVEHGRVLVPLNNARSGGNFALLPNGVFWIAGRRAGVTETQVYRHSAVAADFATQSGPLLVWNSVLHPAFRATGTSFKVRSGVGVCRGGRVRFAISEGPVNFSSFATFFRDTLHCPDALYLDGSISAYATPMRNTQLAAFAGMWSVSR